MLIATYRGAAREEIKALLNSGDYQRHLLDHYLDQMLPQVVSPHWAKGQPLQYLAWLAKRLLESGQSIFNIEFAQVAWLSGERAHKRFRLFQGVLMCILFALLGGLIFRLIYTPNAIFMGMGEMKVYGLSIGQLHALSAGVGLGRADLRAFPTASRAGCPPIQVYLVFKTTPIPRPVAAAGWRILGAGGRAKGCLERDV